MIKQLRIILFATLGLSALFTVSCDKDMSISLDNDNLDNLNVTSDDTLSATVSTVQMPNIPTSGSGVVLVGKVSQPTTGSLKSTSYFRLNPTGITSDIPTNAKFDSLNLVLVPSYWRIAYGDTTKLQTISAHRLTQSLETKTIDNSFNGQPNPFYITGPAIFGHQKFSYSANELGSVKFLPKKSKKDTVSMRLNDALGTEFFNKIKASDIAFNSASNFQEYFKGLSLVSAETNTAIIGFSDTLQVKVNYSYLGSDGFKKTGSKVLNMTEKAFQYNQFDKDVQGTVFEGLSSTKALESKNTAGITYLQGGTGVVTEIKFPALKEFLAQQGLAVNKAELIIELETLHTGYMPAIPNPILMISDNRIPLSYVHQPFGRDPQFAQYIKSDNLGKKGRYTFNMIEYIKNTTDAEWGNKSLFLSMFPTAGLGFTPYTSVLATQNNEPKVKLNIVYTKFK
ncbi:DUF4270 family protein [Sphingobacterium sp. NPDC055346]